MPKWRGLVLFVETVGDGGGDGRGMSKGKREEKDKKSFWVHCI